MKSIPLLLLFLLSLTTKNVNCESLAAEEISPTTRDVKRVLVELESKMSGIQTLETGFIQEKKLQMFEQKIVLEGMLFLQKPALFAWHVKKPIRYSTIINEKIIRQWDEDSKQVSQISLISNPLFETAISQMRIWFLGAYVELLNDYTITILSDRPLMLEFVPRDSAVVKEVISKVVIMFREDQRYINQIRIEEKNGDNTQFNFVDTKLNMPIEPIAWEVKARVQ